MTDRSESAVLRLQREALDGSKPVADILRTALLVARKLQLNEFADWLGQELDGYGSTKMPDIPEYRAMEIEVQALRSMRGWIRVHFKRQEREQSFAKGFKSGQPMAEIEYLASGGSPTETLVVGVSSSILNNIRDGLDGKPEVRFVSDRAAVIGIVDRVRTIVLNWAITLEQQSIVGEGLLFSDQDVAAAQQVTQNINYFYGPVSNSQIQQGSHGSDQESG